MANWTPDSFIGQLFKAIGRYVPPPAGVASPAQWGSRDRINELFEAQAKSVLTAKRHFVFRYRSPEHWLEVFRGYYGPVLKAFGALDADGQQALAADLVGLMKEFNTSGGSDIVLPSAYLEIVITRR
jgi:hypothetical protein